MTDSPEYDVVIVGAGSAGCALAGRLSERADLRVALVEAGGWDRDPWISVPAGYYRTAFRPALNWGYETEPEAGLAGRRNPWPRGKVVGGCSSINGLVYMRGQRADYERWSRMGAVGWGWADMEPVFRRIEGYRGPQGAGMGRTGPLAVRELRYRNPVMEAYVRAAVEAGIPRNANFNGTEQEGVGTYQLTIRRGRRCSAARAYLRPARRRRSLDVLTSTRALRIRMRDLRACGVEVLAAGRRRTLRARREVVLCAGAIASPQLLELSGIGDPAALKSVGVEPVVALSGVGANLQDHLQVKTVFRASRPVTLNDALASPLGKLRMALEYAFAMRGALTVGAAQVGVFARAMPDSDTPDVQFHVMPASAAEPAVGLDRFSAFTATVCVLRPESRGEVRLRSADPLDLPRISANYLDAERDRRTLVAALRLSRRIAAQPALAPFLDEEALPGRDVESDAEWLDWAAEVGTTIYHPCGTCRMGTDPDAVVNPELQVRGVRGLRVADASVMPTLLSGNTNAACIAVGERLADMLLDALR